MLVLQSAVALALLASQPVDDDDDLSNLESSLTRHQQERYSADLDEVKRRGVLRVLTRNNSSAYFIARGAQQGFQYELAKAFADELGVRLQMVVPSSRGELIQALLEGEGDLIAAGMTLTQARAEKVRFSAPVLESPRVLVTKRKVVKLIEEPADIAAFTVHVSFRSTTYRNMRELEKRLGVPLTLVDVTDGVEMEEMIDRVSSGDYEATVADEDILELARAAGAAAVARLPVSDPLPKAWAVHPGAPNLQAAADKFIALHQKDGLIRILYGKYFRTKSKFAARAREMEYRADASGGISPYDDLFKEAARKTGIDWRLLAALSYTESRFDPKAASRWGAVGLMQVLPSTAKSMGFTNLLDPRTNVLAGAHYLKRLANVFDQEGVEQRQQIRFAIASYNAGFGHVLDARKLAVATGRNPNRWFGNVERALELKQDRKWHEKTRYGYCRAVETVTYVSKVQTRYDAYARHVPLKPEEAAAVRHGPE